MKVSGLALVVVALGSLAASLPGTLARIAGQANAAGPAPPLAGVITTVSLVNTSATAIQEGRHSDLAGF
jgi:hypothetical protein